MKEMKSWGVILVVTMDVQEVVGALVLLAVLEVVPGLALEDVKVDAAAHVR